MVRPLNTSTYPPTSQQVISGVDAKKGAPIASIAIPPEATKLLFVAYNELGEGESGTIVIADKALPTHKPQRVVFEDTDGRTDF